MSNSIHDILQKLSLIEAKITPAMPKINGLNAQQKSVPQLSALFKPKSASPVLSAKKDPAHPMDGYMVGDSVVPKRNSLEEAMQEVEEDMLSKVKKDLTQYLDRLEQKVKVDRELKDKAKDEVEDENPAKPGRQTSHGTEEVDEDPTTSEIGDAPEAPPASQTDPTLPEDAPAETFTFEDGTCLECWGNDEQGYEIRHGDRKLPTRFPNKDHAKMAIDLYRAKRKNQAPVQDQNQDYIEER